MFFLSVNDTLRLGAHDVEKCQESEGCVEVEIIQVWIHDNYTTDGRGNNDIAVVR